MKHERYHREKELCVKRRVNERGRMYKRETLGRV